MNVSNYGNTVDGQDVNPDSLNPNFNIHLSAVIGNSDNRNHGVWNFNQDVGNMSNQGNVVVVSTLTNLPAFANAQAEADQSNSNNRVRELENPGNPVGAEANKSASINGSINDNVGIVTVNQNVGNMNNQTNGVAVAVGLQATVAMSEAALGQVNGYSLTNETQGNRVTEAGVIKQASMANSMNGNIGVGGVNQAAGNMANQANIFSAAFVDSGSGLGLNFTPPAVP